MGMPKTRGCPYDCDSGILQSGLDSAGLFKAGLLNNRQGLMRNLNSDMKA